MDRETAHRVSIERVDSGAVLASIEPVTVGATMAPDAISALARESSLFAISSISRLIDRIEFQSVKSSVTQLRAAAGALSAAALVDSFLAERLADDIRRNGSMSARVNVAVVDAAGDAVALGSFEYDVRTA